MAVLSKARAMAFTRLPRLQLVCGGFLAALFALNIDAVRLNEGAVASEASMVEKFAARASAPLEGAAARAQRDRDLHAASKYIDSIDVEDYLNLGNIKNILERFENIRERMLSFGAARDERHRLQIRNVLREVREQGEALNVLAGELAAEGEVDDGGDDFPTQRDNICSRISDYRVAEDFLEMVELFCEYLDTVRKTVSVGEDEEGMAYTVSGVLNTMTTKADFRQGDISWEIDQVLGEERRWVAKHLAPPPVGKGNALPSPGDSKARFRRWPLRAWETQIWADIEVNTAETPIKIMKKAHDALASAMVEDNLSISAVLTRLQRIEFCKIGLAQMITRSDPAFREQIREVLQEIKARMDALRGLAEQKVAAGEVDNSNELLPSQRDNICTKIEAFVPDEDFREDVRKLCKAFDRLHLVVNFELEKHQGVFEALGRMIAIRRRKGYADTPIATELEELLAEEWSWLAQREATAGA